MDIQITWNGADITTSVIEYVREQDICTGQGTLDLTVEAKTARAFVPWNTIIVYENGDKVGTYNIFSAEEQVPGGLYVVSCQDDSKKLTDHFIDQLYIIDYPSTARYWIEKFLTEAQVTYNFNTASYGNSLPENTQFGGISTYDELTYLLQLCGWYYYFDNDNVCQIGKLDAVASSVETFTSNQIIKIGYSKNDRMLRNRAIVWGAGDTQTGQWIYADTSTLTAWNRPGNDYRTVLYSNPAIKTFGIAYSLAYAILSEFSKTVSEKSLIVADSYSNVELGSYITGITNFMTLAGMVTHISVNMSSQGLISTYTLDKRCPRLFGYVNWSDYVYIGTEGAGVWRKWITSPTWLDYSTGITDLNIRDLSAYEGLLGAVTLTAGDLYIRHISRSYWSKYDPGGFQDCSISGEPRFLTSGYIAEACSIDRNYGINGMVTVGYTIPNSGGWPMAPGMPAYLFPESGNLSWVQGVTMDRVPVYTQQIIVTSGTTVGETLPLTDFGIIDLETNLDGINIISVYGGLGIEYVSPSSGIPGTIYGGATAGTAIDYGGLNFYAGGIAGTLGSYNLTSYMPPPTSGRYVEINYTDSAIISSGLAYVDDVYLYYYGNYYLDEKPETNGVVYTLGFSEIHAQYFTYNPVTEWYNEKSYEFSADPWTDMENVVGFYKIDDTHFSALHASYADSEIELKIFEVSDETLTAIVTSTIVYELTDIQAGYVTASIWAGVEGVTYCKILYMGGKYCTVIYSHGPSHADVTISVLVIDMATGSSTLTDILSHKEWIRVILMSATNQSTNFICFGLMYYPDGSGSEYTWYCYPILVSKNNGGVQFTEVPVEYTEAHNIYNIYANNSFSVADYSDKRDSFFLILNENPDTGVGVGKFFVRVNFWDDVGGGETNYIDQYAVIDVYTPTLSCSLKTYLEIWDADYITSLFSDTPLWMYGDGYTSKVTTGFTPIFSRNIYPAPVFCGRYRRSLYDDSYYESVFVDINLENVIELERDSIQGDWTTCIPSLIMDDEDNSIYITCGTNGVLTGYNTDGSINKIVFVYQDLDFEDNPYTDVIGNAGQVAQNKAFYAAEGTGDYDNVDITFFYTPTPASGFTTYPRYMVLKHDPEIIPSGSFTILIEGGGPFYVDTSKNIPTVTYAKPYVDDDPSAYLGRSFLNEYGSFTLISPGGGMGIHDARMFDLDNTLGTFPASGVSSSGFLDRYIGVAGGRKGLVMFNSALENNNYTVILSGVFTHLDFTNNDPDPYIFTSTSGISISGRFFQRNPEELIWNDYSSTLPSGVITIIRADDRM